MAVGEKIMESWAVSDVRQFETQADNSASRAALCVGTSQDGRAWRRAPWTAKCPLKQRAAASQAFRFVSVPGHKRARAAVRAHLSGPWRLPATLPWGSLGSQCPLSPPQNTSKPEEMQFRWNRWAGSAPSLCEKHQFPRSWFDPAIRATLTFLRPGTSRPSSAPACAEWESAQRSKGARGQRSPTSLSSLCKTVEWLPHVRACILKPASERCSNHDSLSTTCPAGRLLGRRGSAPTPTASPLAVQQFTLE